MEYPHELLNLHKDYPLVPERLQIEENILSDYQCHLLQDERFSKHPPKLALNLHNKTNYIIYYCNLKLKLELGLRLSNILCVLLFNQSPRLENYINFNSRQRTDAKNDFEKYLNLVKFLRTRFFYIAPAAAASVRKCLLDLSLVSVSYVYLF